MTDLDKQIIKVRGKAAEAAEKRTAATTAKTVEAIMYPENWTGN
jgi:hypothetical protein